MLRDSYVDGVLSGLDSSFGILDTARNLAQFMFTQSLGKDAAKAMEALDSAIAFAKQEAERKPGLDVDAVELEQARKRREEAMPKLKAR